MKKKAVIFDLDGTLLYTLGDIADSVNRVLRDLCFPEYEENEYKKMVGHGLKEVLRQAILPNEISNDKFEYTFNRLVEDYSRNCVYNTKFYNEIPELLNELISLEIKISVLSNKENELVEKIAGKLLTPWNFFSIQGTKAHIKKKPDPEAVFGILESMNVDPSEAIFVGDSGVDMKTAVNSGLMGVGVTWGYRDIIELTEAGAGILIDKPEKLVRILDS